MDLQGYAKTDNCNDKNDVNGDVNDDTTCLTAWREAAHAHVVSPDQKAVALVHPPTDIN